MTRKGQILGLEKQFQSASYWGGGTGTVNYQSLQSLGNTLMQPDSKLVLLQYSANTVEFLRFNNQGNPDSDFGNQGKFTFDIPELNQITFAKVILDQPNHFYYIILNDQDASKTVILRMKDVSLGTENLALPQLDIFPNPVIESLNFISPLKNPKVMDATGRVLISVSGMHKSMNLSSLKSGVYLLQGYNQQNVMITKQFIKK